MENRTAAPDDIEKIAGVYVKKHRVTYNGLWNIPSISKQCLRAIRFSDR